MRTEGLHENPKGTGDRGRGGGGGVCVGVLPYSANFQEPLASPVVSWEILREDGPVYQSIQI